MISVILPTIREHLWRRAYDSIGPVADEVIVVADFEKPQGLEFNRLSSDQWIERPRRGVVDAVNVACAHATGDYWFLFNDESVLEAGALQKLADASAPDMIVTPRHEPAFPFRYYGKLFAPFPFAHRALIHQLGGLLDPVYRGFYADPDFSLRAHDAGVPIVTVEDAVLRHRQHHDAPHQAAVGAYLEQDRATFRARWDHLGTFADP